MFTVDVKQQYNNNPIADDIISNEKHVQFGQIILCKAPTKSVNCCSVKLLNVHFLHKVIIKQLFCILKFDNSTWIVFSLAINFELPVFPKMAATIDCDKSFSGLKYIEPKLIQ